MVRKKPISIISRLERGIPFSNSDNVLLSSEDILDKANKLRDKASKDAYDKYNASLYPVTTINAPEVPFIQGSINTQPVEYSSVAIPSSYSGTGNKFVSDIYNSYYKAVRPKAASDEDAARQASFLAQKAAFETGYGKHVVNTHNYGGHRTKDKGWLSFNSMDDFTTRDVALLDKKWNNWRNSKTPEDFVNAITTNNGYGVYAPRHEYNGYLNMNRRRLTNAGKQTRPKAWIGAEIVASSAIGAATNILGSIFSANAAKKQAEEQRRLREHQAAIERAEGLNQSLGLMQNAQKEYENRFRVQYAKGGKKGNTEFKITDGGYAIPIGDDTYLLQGSSHDQVNETGQTGIGLDVYAKGGAAKHNQIEAETGEVVEKKPNELRVFSDSIGLNGYSFADLVKMGYDKDELFKIQQTMNNNYGKRKLRNGGCVSSPVERIKARLGIVEALKKAYNKGEELYNRFDEATSTISPEDRESLIATLPDGRTVTIPGVQMEMPTYLPGRAGGFRRVDIKSAIDATRKLSNAVNRSIIRSNYKNIPKAVRRQSWPNTGPELNAGNYAGATVGRGTAFGADINEGSIPISTLDFASALGNAAIRRLAGIPGLARQTLKLAGAKGKTALNNFASNAKGAKAAHVDAFNATANTVKKYAIPGLIGTSAGIGTSYMLGNLITNHVLGDTASAPTTPTRASVPVNSSPSSSNTSTVGNTNSEQVLVQDTVTPTRVSTTATPTVGSSTGNPVTQSSAILTVTPTSTRSVTPTNTSSRVPQSGANTRPTAASAPARQTIRTGSITNPYSTLADVKPVSITTTLPSPKINYNPINIDDNPIKADNLNINTDNTNKFGTVFKGADWAGLAADAVGSITSAIIQSDSANRELDPVPPVRVSPGKLITNWNIAPRLSLVDIARDRMLRDTDDTFSSAARLNRRNEINWLTNNQKDALWGEKTNKEVELGNQDTLNQQQFNAANAENYNRYLDNLIATRNRRRLGQSAALQVGLSGLSDAVGNFLDQGKQRYADQQAMRYYTALLPEEGREWLKRNRVDFLKKGGRVR